MTTPISFAHIDLAQAQEQARELVAAQQTGDRRALDRIRGSHPRFRRQSREQIQHGAFVLADAEHVVARLHHFDNWAALAEYVDTIGHSAPVLRFELAADAVIRGDIDALRAVIALHPDVVRQRSTRAHHSTLLHYVSANGVEDYRQITPPNVLDVARLLLETGAAVDAASEAYGGGSTTLGLASTSVHPRARGVQVALIDLLLAHGARVDGDDTLPTLVRNALANGCPEASYALASRGALVRTLYAAAGCGNAERVGVLFDASPPRDRERALIVAAQQGHREIVALLLDRGVDVCASDGMTALHQASAGGHLDMIDLLVARGAKLEQMNEYGGTVLSSTLSMTNSARETSRGSSSIWSPSEPVLTTMRKSRRRLSGCRRGRDSWRWSEAGREYRGYPRVARGQSGATTRVQPESTVTTRHLISVL